MDISRRYRSWASNLGVPGPIRARAGPPGPQSRNQPSSRPENMDQLTALHKAGLDGYQLNSLPESIGQLGWETVSEQCPGDAQHASWHSGCQLAVTKWGVVIARVGSHSHVAVGPSRLDQHWCASWGREHQYYQHAPISYGRDGGAEHGLGTDGPFSFPPGLPPRSPRKCEEEGGTRLSSGFEVEALSLSVNGQLRKHWLNME